MKRTIKIIALIMAVATLMTLALAGCGEFSRKLNGAELSYPTKITNAKKLSFKMDITYKKGEEKTDVNMTCYRQTLADGTQEYAYAYSTANALFESYKNVYADGDLYEIVKTRALNAGSYYVKEGVSVEDEGNILYHVTQKILLTSAAAFLSKAQQETLKGETVYRYSVMVGDNKVTLWYNSEVLVKIYVAFKDEAGEYTENYTIHLSDYTFDEDLPADAFKRPADYGVTYVESPLSFESWMSIISSFATKLG